MTHRLSINLLDFTPDNRLSINGRLRTHWAVLRVLRDATKWQVLNALGGIHRQGWVAPEFAHVTITFVYKTHRRRDPDGLAGMAKPVLDILVSEGILKDDDAAHLKLDITAIVEKDTNETRIVIEDRNEEA